MAKYPIVCPKCGEKINWFQEVWGGFTIEFSLEKDGKIEEEGIIQEGVPEKVVAHCQACKYYWTLRGISQITELKKLYNERGEQ